MLDPAIADKSTWIWVATGYTFQVQDPAYLLEFLRNLSAFWHTNQLMERMALIVTEWSARQLNPDHLYFLIEGGLKAGSESSPAPLSILAASSQFTLRSFVDSARQALLFPETTAPCAFFLPELRHLNALLLSCGESHVCSMRSGRFLADFARGLGLSSRLVVLPGTAEARPPQKGTAELLKNIIQKRTDQAALERLAEECLPHYFLAAGYIAGGFHSASPGSESGKALLEEATDPGAPDASTIRSDARDSWWERRVQDFRNVSLGLSEN